MLKRLIAFVLMLCMLPVIVPAEESAQAIVINEVMPGEGSIDLSLVTKLAHQLGDDTPVFVEHLDTHANYMKAAAVMREAARKANVPVK